MAHPRAAPVRPEPGARQAGATQAEDAPARSRDHSTAHRIALVHCHRDPFVVANRLRLLRATGTTDVHLLYGGRERMFPMFVGAVRLLSGVPVPAYCLRGRTPLWKWAHTDLAVLDWYRAVGRETPFDAVAVLQWDIAPYVDLDEAYRHVPADGVGLTGLIPLSEREAHWPWLRHHEPYRAEWLELQATLRERHGEIGAHQLCIGPGYILPREFLDRYAAIEVPDLCHDELRLPAFARALGFATYDTRFQRSWDDPAEQEIFNADRDSIRAAVVRRELAAPDGRRVFHPVRGVTPTGLIRHTGGGIGVAPTGHDRLMRAGSGILTVCLQPGRRARSYWNRFLGKVFDRRGWPAVPRAERVRGWHE